METLQCIYSIFLHAQVSIAATIKQHYTKITNILKYLPCFDPNNFVLMYLLVTLHDNFVRKNCIAVLQQWLLHLYQRFDLLITTVSLMSITT